MVDRTLESSYQLTPVSYRETWGVFVVYFLQLNQAKRERMVDERQVRN